MMRYLLALLLLVLVSSSVLAACTNVSPCNCCGNSAMTVKIIAPNGQTYGPVNMTLSGTSGTCSTTTAVTTSWTYALGYTFCPVEGNYDAEFNATVATDLTPADAVTCGETAVETAIITAIYTVSYDADKNWCDCKFGTAPSHWAVGGEVAATTCCGDDVGEYLRSCAGDVNVCNASTDNLACCDAATDCVYNGTCYAEGSTIVVGNGSYTCSGGQWSNCAVPPAADWQIVSHCQLSTSATVGGNVFVYSGGWLELLSGAILHVPSGYVYVYSGGMITVDANATITR